MPDMTLQGITIEAMACAMPTKCIDNTIYYEHYGEKTVNRFMRTTGIKKHYVASEKQTASDLCFVAAKKCIEEKKININSIDALVFVTETPDHKTPSTAFILHKRLGLSKKCMAFDINMGCTAFIHGMMVLGNMIANHTIKRALLLFGDSLPHRKVTEDHTATMMFGDCGACVVVGEGTDEISLVMDTFSEGYQQIMSPIGERIPLCQQNPQWELQSHFMNGGEVFNFAVQEVPRSIKYFLTEHKRNMDDFSYLIFHQANQFILKHIANEIDCDWSKIPISLDRYGNTNGASMIVTLVDLMEKNKLEKDNEVLCAAFGIGLSCGVMNIHIENKNILPMIFTDDYFAEGTEIPY